MRSNGGFSIIEVVAAAGIIGFVMTGLVAITQTSIRAQTINKNALIASMLAQEGLELVRKIRDENWRNNRDWKTGAGAGSQSDILQDFDYTIEADGTIDDTADNVSDSEAQLYSDANGYYTHASAGNEPTGFYRIIEVSDNGDYLSVVCRVLVIRGSGIGYEYMASTLLFNWW
jgi:type II secretory pathway pseudopilin PulG